MTEHPLLVGLDVGTTSIKALVIERDGTVLSSSSSPTPTHYPQTGWAYYEPDQIWRTACTALSSAIADLDEPERITGIAVASVGETAYPVDSDGEPTYHGIAWFDGRSKQQAEWLAEHIGTDRIYKTCRMSIQPIYGLCKLLWMRDNQPEALDRTRYWLNTADFIAFKLCGEAATDPSLASRALLFDVNRFDWATDLLEDCDLSPNLLAPLKRSGSAVGSVLSSVATATGLPTHTVVATGGHDHVVGALGVGVTEPGVALNSLGTAEALFLPIMEPLNKPEVAAQGYSVGGHVAWDRYYAIGGLYSSGGSVDWVKALLGDLDQDDLLASAADVEPGSLGVCFLPHLRIANPPFGDAPSRGAFVGLNGDVDRATVYRAVLEGIAFEAKQCLQGLLDYAGLDRPDRIVAIGGSTRNDLLMSIKASVYGSPISVSEIEEGTALGAAVLGGLGAQVYKDVGDVLSSLSQSTREVEPDPQLAEQYFRVYDLYQQVYPSLKELNASIERT